MANKLIYLLKQASIYNIMKLKLKKYIRYTLTIGAFAHLIEFASAMYETAYITAGISIFFGFLDALAVFVLKED